jgi:hypothetical protein
MPIDFPTSPSTNQTYTFGTKTWSYNGTAWQLVTTSNVALINVAQTFTANQTFPNAIVTSDLFVGASAAGQTAVATNPIIVAKDAGATYTQIAMINSSNTGSADFAAYGDNGTDASGWVDMGFTGSAFNDANYTITGKNDGYVFTRAVDGTGFSGNLVLATGNVTANNTGDIVFGTGGFLTANEKMRFVHSTGSFTIKTNTASTNLTTGALVVSGTGGAAIGGNLNLGGSLNNQYPNVNYVFLQQNFR